MRYVMVSVFDSAVQCYAPPYCVKSRGEALRSFDDACKDEKLPFRAHPSDYRLYILGVFDDSTGGFETCAPELLCSAVDYVVRP